MECNNQILRLVAFLDFLNLPGLSCSDMQLSIVMQLVLRDLRIWILKIYVVDSRVLVKALLINLKELDRFI